MAAKSDIEAGRAHILVYLKNSALTKGLQSVKQQMQGLGSGIMQIGGSLTALGAGLVAPFAAAVLHFSKVGSELNDMSERTGQTVGSLAELKFAAEQTGAGLEDVEKAIKKQQQNGSELTFDQMAAKIAAIEDPALRTAAAMENWGKAGTKLLPMVNDLQRLRQEARDLGLVPTEEAVGMADAIGDALDKIKSVASATVFEIGAAIGPVLLPALETVKNIAGWFNRWAKENGAVIRTVALVAAGLLAAGAVITGIGAAIFGIGSAFGLAASALAGLGGLLTFLLNPATLLVAAIAGGVYVWARFTESGRAALQGILDFFAPLLETARTTIGGIGDALVAGDLTLAGQIAVTGLRLVMLQGLEAIAGLMGETLGGAIANIGGKLLRGDLAGAWQSTVKIMAAGWDAFASGIVSAFRGAVEAIRTLWNGLTSGLTASIDGIAAALRARGLTTAATALQVTGVGVRGLASQGDQALGFTADAAKAVEAAFANKAEASAAEQRADQARGAAQTSAEVARLTEELAALRQQAAVAREAAALPRPGGRAPDAGDVAAAKASFVTFSAAALAAQGAGAADPQIRELREQKRIQQNLLKEAEKTRQKLDTLQILATA